MSTFIKKCIVALVVVATLGSGARSSWATAVPFAVPAAPGAGAVALAPFVLIGAVVAIVELVSAIQSACDDDLAATEAPGLGAESAVHGDSSMTTTEKLGK